MVDRRLHDDLRTVYLHVDAPRFDLHRPAPPPRRLVLPPEPTRGCARTESECVLESRSLDRSNDSNPYHVQMKFSLPQNTRKGYW